MTRIEDAEKLVVEMKLRNMEPNFETHKSMIIAYTFFGKIEDAERVLVEMKLRGFEPD